MASPGAGYDISSWKEEEDFDEDLRRKGEEYR